MLFALLLWCASGPASAAETQALVLDDIDRHGYVSPLLAIGRLQSVQDRPGPAAPVEQQLRYHSALAQLAAHGNHKKVLEAAVADLARLAESGRCLPCGAQLLAVRAAQAEANHDRAAVKPLLEQLAAQAPAADPRVEAERLATRARGHALLAENDVALGLGVQAVDTAGRAKLPAAEARMMNVLVRVHFARGDLASALRVTNDCYALAERIGFRYLMAQARINRNYAYGTLQQEARAQEALLDVLRITKGAPGTEALEQIA